MPIESHNFPMLGWREWVALPALDVPLLECKVDTGARTSALHAFYVEPFEENGIRRVRFGLHPDADSTETELHCLADIHDERVVSDSGGHREKRIVVLTPVVLGDRSWPIEITLTNRDTMRFRMLLGRSAIADNFVVDPGASRLMKKPAAQPSTMPYVSQRHDEEE